MPVIDPSSTLTVALGERSYPIHFGRELGSQLRTEVLAAKTAGRRLAVVTDMEVMAAQESLFAQALDGIPCHAVPAGEASK